VGVPVEVIDSEVWGSGGGCPSDSAVFARKLGTKVAVSPEKMEISFASSVSAAAGIRTRR
jgi:hypothetical protein